MAETDISLSVGLKIEPAEKTAKQLQKEIENIFESRRGEQSASLTNLEIQMKKNYDTSVALRESLEEFKSSYSHNMQMTAEYEELNKKLEETDLKYDELIAKRDEMLASGDVHPADKRLAALDEELVQVREQIFTLVTDMEKLEDAGRDFIPIEATEQYKKLNSQLDIANDKLKQQIIRYSEIEQKEQLALAKASQKQAQAGQDALGKVSLEEMKQRRAEIMNSTRSMSKLTKTVRGFGRIIPGMHTSWLMGVNMITSGITQLTSLTRKDLVGALKTVATAFKDLTVAMATNPILLAITAVIAAVVAIWKVIKKTKEQVDKLVEGFLKGAKQVLNALKSLYVLLGKKFVQLGLYLPKLFSRGIKTVISKLLSLKSIVQENLTAIAAWNHGNNQLNESLSNITSSLTYLKATIASVVVPIVNLVEPMLTRIIDTLAEMTTQVGMFIAKITGASSFQKAIRLQRDYADSVNETSGSLSSFDKLNVLGQDNKAVDFDIVELEDSPIASWLKDLESLGKKVGVVVTNALGNIPWKDIQEGAKSVATSVADFINGLTGTEGLGDAIGRTFGRGLNTITTFINDFLKELDGVKLGQQIGEFFDTAIRTANFASIGKMFSGALNELTEIIKGFTDKFNGADLGNKLTEFLQNALGGINWDTIQSAASSVVSDIVGLINAFITPESFELLASTVANTLNTITRTVRDFAFGTDWKQIGDSIGTAINTFFTDTDWDMAASAIQGLAKGLLRGIRKAVETIDWNEVSNAIITFISDIDWAGIANEAVTISKKLRDGLQSIWEELKNSDALDRILDLVVDFLNEKKNWEKTFKKVKKNLVWKLFWAKAGNGLEEVGKILSKVGKSIKDFFVNGFSSIGQLVKIAFESVVTAVSNFSTKIKNKFNDLKISIQAIWGKIAEKIIGIWDKIKEGAKKPINGFLSVIETMINKVIDGFNWMIEKLNKLSFDVPDWVPGIGGETFGFNIGKLGKLEIPRLATGTVIPPNMSNFLAMLGDNNKETEVVSPLSTIEDALRNVLSEQHINVTFKVEGDPNKIFSVVQKEAKSYNKRTGSYAFGGA